MTDSKEHATYANIAIVANIPSMSAILNMNRDMSAAWCRCGAGLRGEYRRTDTAELDDVPSFISIKEQAKRWQADCSLLKMIVIWPGI